MRRAVFDRVHLAGRSDRASPRPPGHGRRRRAGGFARPARGCARDQARPLPRLRQFRLARLHRAQLALADRRCASRRAGPRQDAWRSRARASGRPSRRATNCSRSAPTGARSRLSHGRLTKRRTRAERMSTIARRRSRPSRPSWISINPPSCAGVGANPLVAQNHTYTRYEGRLNEPEYDALAGHGWSLGQNLPDPAHPAALPTGSIAVKAAWRPLNAADSPAVRARYYVVENANIVDVAKTLAAGHVVCSKSDVALVGLHIVIRTKDRPQGLWGTFEHVDNVPPAGMGEAREPDARRSRRALFLFRWPEAQARPLADLRPARHSCRSAWIIRPSSTPRPCRWSAAIRSMPRPWR